MQASVMSQHLPIIAMQASALDQNREGRVDINNQSSSAESFRKDFNNNNNGRDEFSAEKDGSRKEQSSFTDANRKDSLNNRDYQSENRSQSNFSNDQTSQSNWSSAKDGNRQDESSEKRAPADIIFNRGNKSKSNVSWKQ